MTGKQNGAEILKTDRRGRLRTPPERRQEILAQYDQSGLSGPKFAQLIGIKYQTFAGWRQQRRKEREKMSPAASPASAPSVQWLETVIAQAQTTSSPGGSGLRVRLPSGATLEVMHLSQVSLAAALLRAWESPDGRAAC